MIKTKVIETPKGRLLVVGGLPEDAEYFTFILKTLFWAKEGREWNTIVIDQKGEWLRLGKLSNITEEQAKEVVQEDIYLDHIHNPPVYLTGSHKTEYDGYWTDKEALLSLVESEVSLKNRLGEYPTEESTGLEYGMEYLSKVDDWEEEQDKIFTNPVLFWEPQSKKP